MQTVTPATYRRLTIEIPLTAALVAAMGVALILGFTSNLNPNTATAITVISGSVIGFVVRAAIAKDIQRPE